MPKGSPEDLLNALNMRIEELSGSNIESATDIEASRQDKWTAEEILDFFESKLGWNRDDKRVQDYANAVMYYMNMSLDAWRDAGYEKSPYTLEQWYEDTKMNYPDEIAEFEELYSSTAARDNSCTDGVCDTEDREAIYGMADSDTYEYISRLMDIVMSDCPNVTGWTLEGSILYIDVDEGMDDGEDATMYEVPISDLYLTESDMLHDCEYIEDALLGEII